MTTTTTNNTTKELLRKEWEATLENNETTKKIKEICEKYWYEASYWFIQFNSPRVWVRPLDWKCKYYPDVNLKHALLPESINPDDWCWEINAWAYWSMEAREFKVMMFYFNQALKMVEELNKVDLSKLPVFPKELSAY